MSDSVENLTELNNALVDYKKRSVDGRVSDLKFHELLGALSCYITADKWNQALNTTFGYIGRKP